MAQQATPPLEPSSPVDGNVRKRVCKACDRCRLKKSKCDGANPCSRCKADNAICVFGERKKSHDKVYPKGYVELLEQQQAQLVTGLQELYRRTQTGQGWTGSPLKESTTGNPLTHDILDRLGALKQDGHQSPEAFEEDLHLMQQRLIASGVGFMQRTESSDGGSDAGHSPIFDSMPIKQQIFSDNYSMNQFPPTPPSGSPFPRSVHPAQQRKSQTYVQPTPMQAAMNPALLQRQSWAQPSITYDDNMDFIRRFDSPASFDNMSQYTSQMPMNTNPCLSMPDWNEEDEFKTFFNPTLL